MKGFKGFDKSLKCRDKQYEIGKTYEEEEAKLCNKGLHFCELPHDVFGYYSAGESRFAEIEAGDITEEKDSDSKRVCKTLTVKAEISVFKICRIAITAFFERFEFRKKISEIPEGSAANAGDCGAAIVRHNGSATAGKQGVAIGLGKDCKVKGALGALLVLTIWDDNWNITGHKTKLVDGEKIKADTFYTLKGGRFVEVKE